MYQLTGKERTETVPYIYGDAFSMMSRHFRTIIFFLFLVYFSFIHIVICAHIVSAISSPLPFVPYLSPHQPIFQAEPVLNFSPVLLKRRHSNNKKDITFWLVEIRIAIQRNS
jgi:hypothetical protein